MQEISGRTYYQKDEFYKELMLRLTEKAKEMNVSLTISLKVAPVYDPSGTPIAVRMYSFDDIPVINTSINQHGFYFMNQKADEQI